MLVIQGEVKRTPWAELVHDVWKWKWKRENLCCVLSDHYFEMAVESSLHEEFGRGFGHIIAVWFDTWMTLILVHKRKGPYTETQLSPAEDESQQEARISDRHGWHASSGLE